MAGSGERRAGDGEVPHDRRQQGGGAGVPMDADEEPPAKEVDACMEKLDMQNREEAKAMVAARRAVAKRGLREQRRREAAKADGKGGGARQRSRSRGEQDEDVAGVEAQKAE
eukprot:7336766-Lingulodinium_polyedra.AAC.1